MKFLYTTLFALLVSVIGVAQRTANASPSSDFKTIKGSFIESEFHFENALTNQESSDVLSWAKGNEPNMVIDVSSDGKQLTLKLTADYNQRALYEKLFFQINVDEITSTVNGKPVTTNKETFFVLHNL